RTRWTATCGSPSRAAPPGDPGSTSPPDRRMDHRESRRARLPRQRLPRHRSPPRCRERRSDGRARPDPSFRPRRHGGPRLPGVSADPGARILPGRQHLARLIEEYLPALKERRYPAIARGLGIPIPDVINEEARLLTLNPIPARGFGGSDAATVMPDVHVLQVDGDLVVRVNDDG